ncbi:MAG: 4Fe-4S binding protein [Bacteroidales bacterium]|nr:4Fe-4S binding protein [Bacteroidales bacterium]
MATKKIPFLKQARQVLACSAFILFVLLFMDWGGVFDKALGWLPRTQFYPAVIGGSIAVAILIIVLTMVFGRVYCSVLCPWGLLQDGIYRIRTAGPKKRRFRMRYTKPCNAIRLGILAAFLAAVAFGFGSIAYLIEPYSNFGNLMGTLKGRTGLEVMIVAAVTLVVLVLFVVKGGRAWCNTLCPVGTILGIFSRRSLFRPVINEEKCVSCGLCGKACRASCIDTENHVVDMSRCILCFDCLDNCKEGAIEYRWTAGAGSRGSVRRPSEEPVAKGSEAAAGGNSRRAFISAAALAVGTAALKAADGQGGIAVLQKKVAPERSVPISPAGSSSVASFNRNCIGCQLCVSVCPNGVLSPAVSFDNFMHPVMNYEKGFCRPECTACSNVCPTGAIRKISVEEKSSISIGHAVYNSFSCVVNTDGVSCGNCARHCPSGAITMVQNMFGSKPDLLVPSINTEKCIGCGSCEYVCPARPVSAIYVEGNEVHHVI